MTDATSGISLAVFRYFPAAGISPLNLRRVYGIMSGSQAGVMELVDVVDSKSHSSVVTTSAEALDFSRKFDNSICK
jgi:hypothetical protein